MREKEFFIRLGRRIKELRREKGLRQEDMEEFGIAYKYFQRIESPGSKPANITMKTLLKIANALEVEPIELFDFDEE
jgi:transcriptional regulator with XRE-family HTH domain